MLSFKTTRRRSVLTAFASSMLLAAVMPGGAQAQTASKWPDKPVHIVVPFTAGGPADIIARALANSLSSSWGQPVVVENRGGANGTIGTAYVARAKPDGHTLLLAAVSHVMNPSMFPKLTFDPVKSFTPISRIGSYPMALIVQADSPFRTVGELTAAMKKAPGTIAVASTGPGSAPHLAAALMEQASGTKFLHVSYQGAGPMFMALLAGEVKASFQGGLALEHVRSGKLRPLAVTGSERLTEYPDVPTFAESGYPGYDVMVWYGLMAPAGLEPELLQRIYRDVQRAMGTAAVKGPMEKARIAVEDMPPAAFKQSMERETALWRKVIQEGGIKAE
ncbi:Bug family tripartite tricarboxylate transporter substrate binding protein [Ottowia thiooxydans]